MQRLYNATIDPSQPTTPPKFHNSIDFTGKRFGRLTVVRFAGRGKRKLLIWECLCDCGKTCLCYGNGLTSGAKRSCGCLGSEATSRRSKTHGMTGSITWTSWHSMRDRCERPGHIGYHLYGGRGITVCERWKSFENFLADMGERPSKDHQIERKDNNGNYEPSNCRWATRKEQARNRRTQTMLTYNGETLCVSEWAERLGVERGRLQNRINLGWPADRILTEPIAARRNFGRNRLIEWNGQARTINGWAKAISVPPGAIRQRLGQGWSIERALTTPHNQRRSRSS